MATPTNTIQISGSVPNVGAPVGGKIPIGTSNQGAADEKFIALTVYKRGTNTPISTNVVVGIEEIDGSVQGETLSAKDSVGQTANAAVKDEAIQIEVTARPMGSTLGDGAATDALKGASLPPKLAYCAISNAPALLMGWCDGVQDVSPWLGALDSTGDALNSCHWQVQDASNTILADGYWGVRFTLKRFKSPWMRNPAPPASLPHTT